MIKFNFFSTTNYWLFAGLCMFMIWQIVYAHMDMAYPPPRTKNTSPYAPLHTTYTACHGIPANATKEPLHLKAGDIVDVKFDVGSPHGGGHCEFSLSYSTGENGQPIFVAIKTIIRRCFLDADSKQKYLTKVKIPEEVPQGRAIFAWTWVNAIGNREFYMACSDVYIESKSTKPFEGPEMVVANLQGHFYKHPELRYQNIKEYTTNLPKDEDGRMVYLKKRSIIKVSPNEIKVGKDLEDLKDFLEGIDGGLQERLYLVDEGDNNKNDKEENQLSQSAQNPGYTGGSINKYSSTEGSSSKRLNRGRRSLGNKKISGSKCHRKKKRR